MSKTMKPKQKKEVAPAPVQEDVLEISNSKGNVASTATESSKSNSAAFLWLDKYGKANSMPDENTAEGRTLTSIYENAALNDQKAESSYQQAQLDASKAYDLSQKYLAVQNQANGLGGLGLSDTTALRAASQYQNALADAYATKEKTQLENYQDAMNRADTVRGEWDSQDEAKFADVRNTALSITDPSGLNRYLEANGITQGSEKYNSLLAEWEAVNGTTKDEAITAANNEAKFAPNVADASLKGAYNTANDGRAGDNFEISFDNATYKVERGEETSAETNAALSTAYQSQKGVFPNIGDTMTYNGEVYIYLENNDKNRTRWVQVQGRYWDKSDYYDLKAAMGLTEK